MTPNRAVSSRHPGLLSLYRMPWSLSDNAFSWLEPTRDCDLDCPYCYQVHDPRSHKTLERFEAEADDLARLRRSDAVIIAGGEPLTHPRIAEVVRAAAARFPKTLLLTNGRQLTPERVRELKRAGLRGFLFHVDRHQDRPGWAGKTEREMNALRQSLADRVHEAGGLLCGFNVTVLPDCLDEVADVVRWLAANVHKVHLAVLIPVRGPHPERPYDYFDGGRRVDLASLPFARPVRGRDLTAEDLAGEVRRAIPGFRFSAYLGGTLRSDVPKWLFGTHLGVPGESLGCLGPKAMEILQGAHHAATGRYLSLPSPRLLQSAALLFLLAPFDRGIRQALGRRVRGLLRRPLGALRRLHAQTIVVMQPLDVLDSGEQDLCDGCPNKTVWQGRLVSECRLEEHRRFGRCLTMVRRDGSSAREGADVLLHRMQELAV